MNPFNLIINYIIANSRASFYNISGNQDVTNTALLAGMISDNPLLSYLIIDNKAKAEGENSVNTSPVVSDLVIHSVPALPPSGAGTPPAPPKEEPKKDTTLPKEEVVSEVVLGAIQKQIADSNRGLEERIVNQLNEIKGKLDTFENDKTKMSDSITKLATRVEEVAKANQAVNTKPTEPDVKQQSKTNPK